MMFDTPANGLIGLAVLFALILGGVRIGVALGLVGMGGLAVVLGPEAAVIKAGVIAIDTLTRYELGTLPLFLLMAQVLLAANASGDMFAAASRFVGHRPGGLAYAAIAGCAGFGAINGSSLATAATVGSVALPEMRRRGYSDSLATGTVAAGGTLGQMIPPSGALIVFGIIAETSIGELFTAAIIPGITQALLYFVVIWLLMRWQPDLAPESERTPWPERWQSLTRIWDIVVLILLVIGGIAFGWISPPEAAAVGAAGSFLIAMRRGGLSHSQLFGALEGALKTSGMIVLMLIGALIFSVFVAVTGLTTAASEAVTAMHLGPVGTLVAIAFLLLALGSVLDGLALMLLTTPILLPIVRDTGMTPVWFGIFITRAMEMGLVHPPLGMNLYVIQSVAKDVSIGRIFRGVAPFLASDFFHLLLLILVPGLALWLPGVLS
ncbi:MAG: TRAP transporter large permease [Planctomycetes bacterium]|nr:TRAP transporter large permease [Planctomycetota bacterium]